jgi:chromosome segregation ATPase
MVRTRASDGHTTATPPPSQGTRRKRRASSVVSLNDDVENINVTQPANQDAVKPRKRRARRSDSEQLDQELGDAAVQGAVAEPTFVQTVEVEIESSSKHVHFPDPMDAPTGVRSSPPAHTNRSTLSPSIRPAPTKSRKIRHSLPARLTGTPDRLVNQVQFTPLRQVLSGRNQRRLKRNHLSEEMNLIEEHDKDDARKDRELKRLHEEIELKDKMLAELQWEVEDRRQRGIEISSDDAENAEKIKTMEAEIAKMREEVAAQHLVSEDDDTDVEDDLVFIDPVDINVSQEDMTPITSFEARPRPVKSSLSPVPDRSRETEIQKFEKAVVKLTQEAADARAALQNVNIELQSLGFSGQDEPGLVICSAIRQAFEQARIEAEELLPEQAPNTYEGEEFLKLLIDNIRGLLQQVNEDMDKIHQLEEMEALLKGQHNGLLDQLSQTELRKTILEKNCKTLDRELDAQSKRIVQFEEDHTSLNVTIHTQGDRLARDQKEISELESQNTEQALAIDRLKDVLEEYRTDLTSMEALVKKMEEEHAAKIVRVKEDAAQTIEELQVVLANEKENLHTAETEIDDKTTQITQLQIDIESAETKVDELKQQLADSKAHAASETEQREETEAELAQKSDFIDELEGKIAYLESKLEEYRNDANKLNDLLDTERSQREATEAELDLRGEKISDIESRLHDEEIRANELRMKLFEEQQEREKAIAELEATAVDREEQYQGDIDLETSRREESERVVAARDSKITELEQKIHDLDTAMVELIKAKDELQQEREDEIERLEANLTNANDEFEQLAKDKATEIQELQDTIATLSESLGQRDNLIQDLEAENKEISEARQTENEDKDGQIADLGDDLHMARNRIADLEAEKGSLEIRVENEASHLLQCQNEAADTIQDLRDQLRDRNNELIQLRKDAINSGLNHKSEIQGKVTEITELHAVNVISVATIGKLKGQVAVLQDKLKARVNAERNAVPTMLDAFRTALAQAEVTGDSLLEGGDKDLVDVEHMDGIETSANVVPFINGMTNGLTNGLTNGVTNGLTNGMVNGHSVKVTKRRRVLRSTRAVRDSGFGMASDSEEAELEDTIYA